MEIHQISKYYDPYYGGIESVVQDNAEGVAKHGDSCRVLSTVPQGRGREDEVNGIPVTRTPSLGELMSVPLSPTFPYRLSRTAKGASVIHYHLPNPVAAVSHLLSRPDTPTVATYHSDIVRQSAALRIYKPVLMRFLKDVDRIVATSPRILNHSEILSEFSHKSTVVPLAVDLDRFGLPGSASDECLPDLDGPVVLFVGRLSYYKGVQYLVEAMSDIEGTLVIVGDGKRRERLEGAAERTGIGDRVRFLGHVPEEELHALYDRADVFALPSIEPSEAFGVVQLEAMAYGTPVVNTLLPTGVPWVSQDGETGISVPPGDSEALADGISELIEDETKRDRYGRAARKRVESRFSRGARIERLREVYRDLVQ